MDASATTADLERIERDIKRAEGELLRRGLEAVASGKARCLRVIVHEGEDEAAACERARKAAGLSEGQAVFIVRKIVAPRRISAARRRATRHDGSA